MNSDKAFPWLRIMVQELDARTRHLTAAEFGTLLRFVNYAWYSVPLIGGRAGSIPDDPDLFERIAGSQWRADFRGVRENFQPDPEHPNVLTCAWLRAEYEEAEQTHRRHVEAGRRGGRPSKGETPNRPHPPSSPDPSKPARKGAARPTAPVAVDAQAHHPTEAATEPRLSTDGDPGGLSGKPGFSEALAELKAGLSPAEGRPKQSPSPEEQEPAASARVRAREPDEPDHSHAPEVLSSAGERERQLLETLPSPFRETVAAGLQASPDAQRARLAAAMAGWREGMGFAGGRRAEPEDLATGLSDYLGGDAALTFTAGHVRRWVEEAQRSRLAREAPPGGDGGRAAAGGDGGSRPTRAGPVGRADALYDLVLRHHLGTVNQLQAEMTLEQARASGELDAETLAELPLLQPWRDLAYAPPAMGRKLARDRYVARRPRPALQVIA